MSGSNCVVCHGANATSSGRANNTGTVLSAVKADRGLVQGVNMTKGRPVGCTLCH